MPLLQCPECGSRNLLGHVKEIECEECGESYPVIFGGVVDFSPVSGFREAIGLPRKE